MWKCVFLICDKVTGTANTTVGCYLYSQWRIKGNIKYHLEVNENKHVIIFPIQVHGLSEFQVRNPCIKSIVSRTNVSVFLALSTLIFRGFMDPSCNWIKAMETLHIKMHIFTHRDVCISDERQEDHGIQVNPFVLQGRYCA